MCLIVYQPLGARVPPALLLSAAAYNPDGFGFMGFDTGRRLRVERHMQLSTAALLALAEAFAGQECAFHFRRRTSGSLQADNLHPFELADGLWLMHNGCLPLQTRIAGCSDTWHLVHDHLRPLLGHRRKLIHDRAFQNLLQQWLGAENRLAVLDAQTARIEILGRAAGIDWKGLWLSNMRWLDHRLLGDAVKTNAGTELGAEHGAAPDAIGAAPLPRPMHRRVYRASELAFG